MAIKSLAMIKMEKNFIAQEKHYPRKPYECYDFVYLLARLREETRELTDAIFVSGDLENAKAECADVSNIVDYIFEKLSSKP